MADINVKTTKNNSSETTANVLSNINGITDKVLGSMSQVKSDSPTNAVLNELQLKSLQVNINDPRKNNMIKWIGCNPKAKLEDSNKYYSKDKALRIYFTDKFGIEFRDRFFYTDDVALIELIESHELFDHEVWKDGFPPHIMDMFKKREEHLTREKPYGYER